MAKYDLAEIIYNVSVGLDCFYCPCPCSKKGHSSIASCQRHWYEMVTQCDKSDWSAVCDKLWEMFKNGRLLQTAHAGVQASDQ